MTPNSTTSRLNLVTLAGGTMAAIGCGTGVALGLASAFGWATGRDLTLAIGLAVATVIVASMAGLALLVLMIGVDLSKIAQGTIASGICRMFVSLALALGVYLVISPEGKTFWTAFLTCNLLCLIAETAWGMVTNQRVHGSAAAPVGAAP